MLHTLINSNNVISILELTKYPVPRQVFILYHMHPWRVKSTTREGITIFCISVQDDVFICLGSIHQGLKATMLSYSDQLCRDWWKIPFTFSRVGYKFLEGVPSG